MPVKLTRAEKTSDIFQEVFQQHLEKGESFRTALRKSRQELVKDIGYHNRR